MGDRKLILTRAQGKVEELLDVVNQLPISPEVLGILWACHSAREQIIDEKAIVVDEGVTS